ARSGVTKPTSAVRARSPYWMRLSVPRAPAAVAASGRPNVIDSVEGRKLAASALGTDARQSSCAAAERAPRTERNRSAVARVLRSTSPEPRKVGYNGIDPMCVQSVAGDARGRRRSPRGGCPYVFVKRDSDDGGQ